MLAYIRLPGLLRLDRFMTVGAPFLLRSCILNFNAATLTKTNFLSTGTGPCIGRGVMAGSVSASSFAVYLSAAEQAVFCVTPYHLHLLAAPHTGADISLLA